MKWVKVIKQKIHRDDITFVKPQEDHKKTDGYQLDEKQRTITMLCHVMMKNGLKGTCSLTIPIDFN